MESFTVAETAAQLGIATNTVYQCLQRGALAQVDGSGPIRVAAASIRTVQLDRSRDAAGRVPGGVTAFASYIRDRLRPAPPRTVTLADGRVQQVDDAPVADPSGRAYFRAPSGGRSALSGLPREAAEIWGKSVLTAAAVPVSGGVCRFCIARMSAAVSGDLPPRDDAATRILLGSSPCDRDRDAWRADRDAESVQRRQQLAAMVASAQRRSRADLAVAEAALTAARKRAVRAGQAARPDNSLAARVLATVDRAGAITPKAVRNALRLAPGQAKTTMDSLVNMGVLVRREGDGWYTRVPR